MTKKTLRLMTGKELVAELKRVVWQGGWDAVIAEIERRLKRLDKIDLADEE